MSAIFSTSSNSNFQETSYDQYIEQLNAAVSINFIYRGQKSGRADKLIQPGTLLFLRKRQSDSFTFAGSVVDVICMVERTSHSPAIYLLELSADPVRRISCGEVLPRIPDMISPFIFKESALKHLGKRMTKIIRDGIQETSDI